MKKILLSSFIFALLLPSLSMSEETLLSGEFKITSLKYRGSNSVGYTRYEDCADCLLIEGGVAPDCGNGFVIKGASGNEEVKFLRSLAMTAYISGKKVKVGREHCVKWDGEWRGHVNRIYIVD